MTPESTHLSDEALDDVLIGLGSPASEAHLAGCPDCRARFEEFQGDVRLFNSASMAWSETRPLPFPQTARHASGLRARVAFFGLAAAAVALLIMAVAIWRHSPVAPPPNRAGTAVSQPLDSEAQIAQDNELLQAVSVAISPDEQSPIVEYKIAASPHSHLKAHLK
jgi:hypothetical protein